MSGRRPVRVAGAALLVLAVLAICVFAAVWRATGGHWYDVRTPSMGTTAPVGTLVLTRPTSMSAIHVGDVITFHPPGTDRIYTHRVVSKTAAGLRTKGDINAARDSWVLTGHDLVGKVSNRLWGVGWVLRGLPLLLICLAVVWFGSLLLARSWRAPVRLAGTAVSFAITSAVLNPWIGLDRLGATRTTRGTEVTVVSDGIFPVRATMRAGTSAQLRNGQVGRLLADRAPADGRYHVSAALDLSWGWWVALILICALPLLWILIVGLPPAADETGAHRVDGDTGDDTADEPDDGRADEPGDDAAQEPESPTDHEQPDAGLGIIPGPANDSSAHR